MIRLVYVVGLLFFIARDGVYVASQPGAGATDDLPLKRESGSDAAGKPF